MHNSNFIYMGSAIQMDKKYEESVKHCSLTQEKKERTLKWRCQPFLG